MLYLISFIFLIPTLARADFVASAGITGGSVESKEISTSGDPLLRIPTFIGFKGEAEFGHPYVTLFGAFDIGTGSARAEYNYQNPDLPSDQAQVSELKTSAVSSKISLGLRVKFIKFKTFRMYVGGGLNYGLINLTYDKEDFTAASGSSIGFEESERKNLRGGFGQLGMEFIIDTNSGFRLQAQREYLRTDEFETLNNKRLKFENMIYSISFMQYIDT